MPMCQPHGTSPPKTSSRVFQPTTGTSPCNKGNALTYKPSATPPMYSVLMVFAMPCVATSPRLTPSSLVSLSPNGSNTQPRPGRICLYESAEWRISRSLSCPPFPRVSRPLTNGAFAQMDALSTTSRGPQRRVGKPYHPSLLTILPLRRTWNVRAANRRLSLAQNIPVLARNYRKSVFYQTDLKDIAWKCVDYQIAISSCLEVGEGATPIHQIHDAMFRAQMQRLRGRQHVRSMNRGLSLFFEKSWSALPSSIPSPHGSMPIKIRLSGDVRLCASTSPEDGRTPHPIASCEVATWSISPSN